MTVYGITCKCGERFLVDQANAGKVITCWRCKRSLKVRPPIRKSASYVHVALQDKPTPRERMRRLADAARNVVRRSRPSARTQPRSAYLATLLSWVACIAVFIVAVLLNAFGDRWSVATILMYAGRWIWLIPFLPLSLIALLRYREALIPNGFGTAIVVGSIMGWESGWRSLLPAPDGEPLRVVTLNTAGSYRVATQLPQLLDSWRADIVAFQECGEQLRAAMVTLERWHPRADGSLCLLSRFPVVAAEVMERSDLERSRADGTGVGGAGFVVRYMIQTSEGPLGFTNLHLETARKGLESLRAGRPDLGRLRDNTEVRAIESQRARAFVGGGVIPMIVAGDFNAPPDSRNLRDDWGDFTNAFDRAGSGFGYTRYNGWIRLRIDHQFHSTGVRAVRARVGSDVGSDHRPLIVDYRILERTSDR